MSFQAQICHFLHLNFNSFSEITACGAESRVWQVTWWLCSMPMGLQWGGREPQPKPCPTFSSLFLTSPFSSHKFVPGLWEQRDTVLFLKSGLCQYPSITWDSPSCLQPKCGYNSHTILGYSFWCVCLETNIRLLSTHLNIYFFNK